MLGQRQESGALSSMLGSSSMKTPSSSKHTLNSSKKIRFFRTICGRFGAILNI